MEFRMQIKISSKHMEITPAIESYATKKVEKLSRFFDRIQQIDVVIDKAKNGYTTEIITDVEHHEPFIATSDDQDLYACIDLGMDRAIRQLKDHKSKLRDNKHHAPTSGIGSTPRPSPATKQPGITGKSA
jgi:putative sigma-54 modulation protein